MRCKPLQMITAALGIHPDDDIVWAMLLRLLFGPEGHEDLSRVPTGCAEERKSDREQPQTSIVRGSLAPPGWQIGCRDDLADY